MKNYKLKINGNDYNVDINEVEGQEMKLEVNGTSYVVSIDREVKPVKKAVVSSTPRVTPAAGGAVQKSSPAPKGEKVQSPLPGTILDVMVNVGDEVKEGQAVVILEAMKMENNIEAPCAGKVSEVKVRKGDSVLENDVLVVIG